MKITRFVLSAAALVALLAAPAAFACDEHAKAGDKAEKMSCAGHAKAGDKASCAAHAKAGAKMACCAEGAKAGGKGMACAKDAKMAKNATACPMKASDAKKTDVAMAGKVLCEHCDLHKADSCRTVFQADGKTEYMPICPMSDVAALKKAGDHGLKMLDVKGTMCEDKKGEKMFMVASFVVKS